MFNARASPLLLAIGRDVLISVLKRPARVINVAAFNFFLAHSVYMRHDECLILILLQYSKLPSQPCEIEHLSLTRKGMGRRLCLKLSNQGMQSHHPIKSTLPCLSLVNSSAANGHVA